MGLVWAKSCSPRLFLAGHGEVLLGRDCAEEHFVCRAPWWSLKG